MGPSDVVCVCFDVDCWPAHVLLTFDGSACCVPSPVCVCVCVRVCACAPQSLTVESVPEPFFPQDLPLVSEEDPKSKWPAPLTATCALRTFEVGPGGVTEVASAKKSVEWPASWADCGRPITGRGGWLDEADAKAAPTAAVLPAITSVR
jgi:hypothetical protein